MSTPSDIKKIRILSYRIARVVHGASSKIVEIKLNGPFNLPGLVGPGSWDRLNQLSLPLYVLYIHLWSTKNKTLIIFITDNSELRQSFNHHACFQSVTDLIDGGLVCHTENHVPYWLINLMREIVTEITLKRDLFCIDMNSSINIFPHYHHNEICNIYEIFRKINVCICLPSFHE